MAERHLLTGDSAERSGHRGVLYLVTSGAPAPEGIPELVGQCQAAGWRVLELTTPHGTRFVDPDALEQLTGQPVGTDYRMPGEAKALPRMQSWPAR